MPKEKQPGKFVDAKAKPLSEQDAPDVERGPPAEPQDFPPPSDAPPADATRPAGPHPPDPFGREGTAKNYPPGAPDTEDDRQPRPYPSELPPLPGQALPPESARFPEAAEARSREMQGIPDLPSPPHPGYIPEPLPPATWVPPKDRPVPGADFCHLDLAHAAATLERLADHIEEKKAVAGSAPWHVTDELAALRRIAGELKAAQEETRRGKKDRA